MIWLIIPTLWTSIGVAAIWWDSCKLGRQFPDFPIATTLVGALAGPLWLLVMLL